MNNTQERASAAPMELSGRTDFETQFSAMIDRLQEKPREYQLKLIRHAVQANSIVALPTGAGKTLIAASVLLYRIMHMDSCWRSKQTSTNGQLAVVVVPRIPLVNQQARYVRRVTGLRVKELHGDSSPSWYIIQYNWQLSFSANCFKMLV